MSMPIQRQSESFGIFDDGPRYARDRSDHDLPSGLAALVNTSGPRIQGGMLNTREAAKEFHWQAHDDDFYPEVEGYNSPGARLLQKRLRDSQGNRPEPEQVDWDVIAPPKPRPSREAGWHYPEYDPRVDGYPEEDLDRPTRAELDAEEHEDDEDRDYLRALDGQDPGRFVPEGDVDPRTAAALRRAQADPDEDEQWRTRERPDERFPEDEWGDPDFDYRKTNHEGRAGSRHPFDRTAACQECGGDVFPEGGGWYHVDGIPEDDHHAEPDDDDVDNDEYGEGLDPARPHDDHKQRLLEDAYREGRRTSAVLFPPCPNCGQVKGFEPYPWARGMMWCNDRSCQHIVPAKDLAHEFNNLMLQHDLDVSTLPETDHPTRGKHGRVAQMSYDDVMRHIDEQLAQGQDGRGSRYDPRRDRNEADDQDAASHYRYDHSTADSYVHQAPEPPPPDQDWQQTPDYHIEQHHKVKGGRHALVEEDEDRGGWTWSHYDKDPFGASYPNAWGNVPTREQAFQAGDEALSQPSGDGFWSTMRHHGYDPMDQSDPRTYEGAPEFANIHHPNYPEYMRQRGLQPRTAEVAVDPAAQQQVMAPAAGGYQLGHRVGLPWRDQVIRGTVIGLDGDSAAVRWDDGQYSTEEPHNIQLL